MQWCTTTSSCIKALRDAMPVLAWDKQGADHLAFGGFIFFTRRFAMQLCKKPVHSYGRYKQSVQLYMPSSPSGIVEEVVEEVAVEVAETLVDIGSEALETAGDLAVDFFTTGIELYGGDLPGGGRETTVAQYPFVSTEYNNRSPDPGVPDSVSVTVPFIPPFIQKKITLPIVPEDAPETDTDDDEKKKSTTGD